MVGPPCLPVCEMCVPSLQEKMQICHHFLFNLMFCVTLSVLSDHTPLLPSTYTEPYLFWPHPFPHKLLQAHCGCLTPLSLAGGLSALWFAACLPCLPPCPSAVANPEQLVSALSVTLTVIAWSSCFCINPDRYHWFLLCAYGNTSCQGSGGMFLCFSFFSVTPVRQSSFLGVLMHINSCNAYSVLPKVQNGMYNVYIVSTDQSVSCKLMFVYSQHSV